MYYKFDSLEKLLSRIEPDQVLEIFNNDKGFFDGYFRIFNDELFKIKDEMKVAKNNLTPGGIVKYFVLHYHNGLYGLYSVVLGYSMKFESQHKRNSSDDLGPISFFYKKILGLLERNISYLLEHFGRYLDSDTLFPGSIGVSLKGKIVKGMPVVDDIFQEWEIENELLGIIKNALNGLLSDPTVVSLTNIRFIETFFDFIRNAHSASSKFTNLNNRVSVIVEELNMLGISVNRNEILLHLMLFTINFNSSEYIQYLKVRVWVRESQFDDNFKLIKYLRIIYKLGLLPSGESFISLYPKERPILKVFGDWLQEELNFRLSNNILQQPSASTGETIENSNCSQIKTNFTVPELILFFRTLSDIGIFAVGAPIEIIRVLSSSFSTVGSVNLNVNTLRGRWWNPVKVTTVDSLLEKLRKCSDHLRSIR